MNGVPMIPGSGKNIALRPEASLPTLLEFHSPTQALAITPALRGARGTSWVVVSLVVACFAASALIPVDKVVTATGRIVVAQQATSVVQPLETAIVRSIDVREGDVVRRGALLARLDPTFAEADLSAGQAQVASLRSEVERLQAEATGEPYVARDGSPMSVLQGALFVQRRAERLYKNENYTQKISSLQAQVQRSMSDLYGYTERLKVASEVEQKRLELERLQVGSQLNRLAATDSRLEVKRGLDGAVAQASQSGRDLQAMKAEQDGYNQQWRSQVAQELTDATRKLSDAQENMNKAALRRKMVELRAEGDSIVLSLAKVSPGAVMQSGEQLITLVPLDAALEAEVNVAGADAGFVRAGREATVKLDTLPYTQYGTMAATVRVVSPDSFTAGSDETTGKRGTQAQNQPQPGATSYYRARATLGVSELHDTPEGFHLMPGMPVTMDIKVGKRTLVSYLLSRVLPVFMDGMREP